MADVGQRGIEYTNNKSTDTLWWVFQILKALTVGNGKEKRVQSVPTHSSAIKFDTVRNGIYMEKGIDANKLSGFNLQCNFSTVKNKYCEVEFTLSPEMLESGRKASRFQSTANL